MKNISKKTTFLGFPQNRQKCLFFHLPQNQFRVKRKQNRYFQFYEQKKQKKCPLHSGCSEAPFICFIKVLEQHNFFHKQKPNNMKKLSNEQMANTWGGQDDAKLAAVMMCTAELMYFADVEFIEAVYTCTLSEANPVQG